MNANQMNEEIRETNLSYLMLAQQMIREDMSAAIFRLGVSREMAETILALTPAQLLKMAASNLLLCRLRFDEKLLDNMVTDHSKGRLMAKQHTAIMMASRPVERLAA